MSDTLPNKLTVDPKGLDAFMEKLREINRENWIDTRQGTVYECLKAYESARNKEPEHGG